MNAYELADELNKYKGIATRDAANMLRQQADRIAELEKQLNIHFKDGFEAGKLEGWKAHKYHSAPQTKPLSDEEIETIYLKTLNKFEFARAIEERHGIK